MHDTSGGHWREANIVIFSLNSRMNQVHEYGHP
jgi:hypothetical protein